MLHEDLQANIIGKDRLTSARGWCGAIHGRRHVRRRRIELR